MLTENAKDGALSRPNSLARGLAVLYGSTFLAGMWSMIVPAVPLLTREFGISPGVAAQIMTALAVGRFVGNPASGVVLDRLGTRTALLAGPALAACAAVVAAIATRFEAMLVAVAVIGFGDNLWTFGREIAGVELARHDQRGRVLSGFHGVNNFGLSIGPLAGGVLAQAVGFRAAFLAYAICAAAAVLLGFGEGETRPAARAAKKRAVYSSPAAAVRQWLGGLKALFHQIDPALRATYVVLVLATLTSFIHRVTMQSMLPLYATAYLALSPREIGLLFSIMGLFVFAMIFPAGFVIDKVGRKWATVPSTGLPALVFLLIPFTTSFFQLAVLMSFMGIANGLSLGSVATSTYDVVPAAARGRLQAFRRFSAETGSVTAPLLGGFLADRFNPGVPFWAYAPLLIVSAVLLALVARETLRR
ncbi:MAG TPA: MFS transporter [Candidatus Binatia bacterium]